MWKSDLAPHQAKADEHRRQGDRDSGEELQNQRREKGDAQHRHRIAAIGLRHLRDNGDFAFRRAKNFQVGQALHGVEQMAAQPRQRRPCARVGPLGALPDEDQEDHGQRQGDDENRPRQPVERRDDGKNGEGNDGAGRQSRKIAPPIGLDRRHRIGKNRHQFAGRRIDQPNRTERADMIEQVAKQGFSHAAPKPGRRLGRRSSRAPRAKQRQGDQELYPAGERSEIGAVEDRVVDDAGQESKRRRRRARPRATPAAIAIGSAAPAAGRRDLRKAVASGHRSLSVAMPAQKGASGHDWERHVRTPARCGQRMIGILAVAVQIVLELVPHHIDDADRERRPRRRVSRRNTTCAEFLFNRRNGSGRRSRRR